MQTLVAILIIVATVLVMEFVAWSSHKYVMHGFGWGWHRDHHEPHNGFFEKNDLYAVVGAAISISFFMIGSPLVMGTEAWWPATFIGLGVMAYGATREEAIIRVETLVLRVLAERLEHGERAPELDRLFAAA